MNSLVFIQEKDPYSRVWPPDVQFNPLRTSSPREGPFHGVTWGRDQSSLPVNLLKWLLHSLLLKIQIKGIKILH